MDWTKGFSASFHMELVDPVTWRNVERVEITAGAVSRTPDGLRQSADITCLDFAPDRERWVRVYLDAAQDDDVEHVPLFTGLGSVPSEQMDGMRTIFPLVCYSVLKPAEDVSLSRGWFAPEGRNGAEVIADLLSVTPAPIEVEDDAPTLTQSVIAEDGENRLTMANKILETINWRLRIDGDGTITICPPAAEISATFGTDRDVIETQLTKTKDWFDCPNIVRAVSDGAVAIARDDDENSMLSTVTRGREIWLEEKNCDLNSGESLEQYAQRRLSEAQAFAYKVQYSRRFDPDVNVGDLVRLHYPGHDLMDVFTVISQSISLGHGARTEEEVQK